MALERVEGVSTAPRDSGEAPVYIMSRKLQKGVRRARKVADRKRRRGSSEARVDKHDGDMSAIYEQNRMLRRSVAAAKRRCEAESAYTREDKLLERLLAAKERIRLYRKKHGLVRAFV